MQIELRPIDSIRPYPGNPRQNDAAVDSVAASLKEFGFRQPIVVDGEGVIIVGHTTANIAAGATGGQESIIMPDSKTTVTDPDQNAAAQDAAITAAAPAGDVGELEQVLARSRAEHERRTRIADMTAKLATDRPELADDLDRLSKSALEAKWDVQRYELEVLRLCRQPPKLFVHQRQ